MSSRFFFIIFVTPCLLAQSLLLHAADPTPAPTREADAPTSSPATGLRSDLDALLADPVAAHPEFAVLCERRCWLAQPGRTLEDFDKVATELARRQAFYPALELLWFADKFKQPAERRKDLGWRMRQLKKAGEELEAPVEAAIQMWDAGRREAAYRVLLELIREHPYCERARYELAVLTLQDHAEQEAKVKRLAPLAARRRIFRACYEQFMLTLAIDPLYDKAWNQLDKIRAIFPDDKDFLVKTNSLSRRAVIFMTRVLVPMRKLDEGDHSPETLLDAADGFAEAGLPEYAVYACRAALSQAGEGSRLIPELRDRLKKLHEAVPWK